MMFFYSIAVKLYAIAIAVASLFNSKAKLWIQGRKQWRTKLKKTFPVQRNVVWFHCASLGEFEQGRPVMEAYKKKYPDSFLLLTFFSPSGYETRKKTPIADYVCYLPTDTSKNSKDFVEITNPQSVFFIKYEFWFHYIKAVQQRDIPLYFLSALFRSNQYYFKWFGRWTHCYFQRTTRFFVQNEISEQLLRYIGVQNITISGDTRFDCTATVAETHTQLSVIEKFKGSNILLVAGSSWQPEETIIHSLVKEQSMPLKIIIAPHDISENHIQNIEHLFRKKCLRYSLASLENVENESILIIDSIGLLRNIYYYADMALIGGAFGKGLHNILEALAYGAPVFFGTRTAKFPEAKQAIDAGCATMIYNDKDFIEAVKNLLEHPQTLKLKQQKSRDFILSCTGATQLIINKL
jgi:3-deoxy-D-manno-octulosonic-acid transferase